MKDYHIYFLIIKIIITILILLIVLKKLPKTSNIYIIFDNLFKISLSVYIIYFTNKYLEKIIDMEDKILIITTGMMLLISIDYGEFIKAIETSHQNLKSQIKILQKRL